MKPATRMPRRAALITLVLLLGLSFQIAIAQTSLRGHTSAVNSLAFSPDGSVIASGSGDETVGLWHAATRELLHTLEGHEDDVTSVAFNPDGTVLASASHDSTVRLWEVDSGALRATLEGHEDDVTSVAFSPDGSTLASGSLDSTIRLWEADSGVLRATLEGHEDGVNSISFSPDGSLLASAAGDDTVRLWNADSGEHLSTLEGHENSVTSVAFSPDGTTLASGSWDNTVRLWNADSGELLRTLESDAGGFTGTVISVAFSPDGSLLASGDWGGTVRLWRVSDGALLQDIPGIDQVWSVAFSPDGALLASSGVNNIVSLWERSTSASTMFVPSIGELKHIPITISASLSSDQVVPAAISSASGTVIAVLLGDQLTITGAYQDLSSPLRVAIGATFRRAAAGENGPEVQLLANQATLDTSYVMTLSTTGDTEGTFSGVYTLTTEQLQDLEDGLYYVQLSTADNPDGELRAQLETDEILNVAADDLLGIWLTASMEDGWQINEDKTWTYLGSLAEVGEISSWVWHPTSSNSRITVYDMDGTCHGRYVHYDVYTKDGHRQRLTLETGPCGVVGEWFDTFKVDEDGNRIPLRD